MGDEQAKDVWREDARTDRAIELLRMYAAKTDAAGDVVAAHRYSRNFKSVSEHLRDFAWDSVSETLTIDLSRDPESRKVTVTVSIEVGMNDGSGWSQEGVATSEDQPYDWYALAACRALLNYTDDDGTPMSPGEVIEMLETERAKSLAYAARMRQAASA